MYVTCRQVLWVRFGIPRSISTNGNARLAERPNHSATKRRATALSEGTKA